MKLYLQDIVNRLAQFSEKLDNTTLFIDKPWVLIDSNSDYHKYIFKRNGELVLSLNGQVQIGKWEYLSAAKSILIDRIKDKVLLNQSFFDSAVMVLKVDGSNNQLFVLANETIIPDLDVNKYLQSLTYKKFNVITGRLENGKTLEIYRGNSETQPQIGMKATIDGDEPEDGKYKSKSTGRYYELRNGKVFRITQPFTHKTADGQNLTIEQTYRDSVSVGDLVYLDNAPAKTGKYKLGFLSIITVVNGVISKKSMF
ncbi:hypothetical protein K8352_14935 [Flavobacteriaceae bacterium F89]|uniref:Uncharacterized protein n=1 Tax=Cerina litoralis TaxID=2874477 RepID=A0AAE3EWA2_9FLAO|nr:hypothetical protein [Cerina litoralis]MCG2462053.1 hypothetical protein [Cerina litoralis]